MNTRKQKTVYIALCFILWWAVFSCKTTEITTNAARNEIRVKDIEKEDEERNQNVPGIWVKKIQGSFVDNNKEGSFKANYKIKRDSIIVISILNPIGIEAMRIVCTQDSFGIVDRMNRNYYYGEYDVLYKKFGYITNFMFIQSLLLNEIATIGAETKEDFFKNKKKLKVTNNHCSVSLAGSGMKKYGVEQEISYYMEFDASTLSVLRNKITDHKRRSEIDVIYKEYEKSGKISFPRTVEVKINVDEMRLYCRLELDKIFFGTDFNTNFRIGQKYEIINW